MKRIFYVIGFGVAVSYSEGAEPVEMADGKQFIFFTVLS